MEITIGAGTALRNPASALVERLSWTVVLAVSATAFIGVVHALNMFGFPSYFQDEGVYQAQAWHFINDSQVPYQYTYWYDHPAAGWIFTGLWMKVFGFFTFGDSLASGRAFVLVLHLASALMLFWIAHKISRSNFAATTAVLLFGLSPYWIIQGRQLMLEPLAVFWMLAAMMPLFRDRPSLAGYCFSGFAFGVAILTKEVFIAFIPGFLMLAWLRAHKDHLLMVMAHWVTVMASTVSLYVLYAVLKGELLPQGWPLAAKGEHVSLIGTLQFHMNRESDSGLMDFSSRFWSNSVAHWFDLDPFLTVATPLCILAAFVLGFRYRILWPFGVLIGGFVLFLGRGGVVFDFYALPLVPLVALVVAVVLRELVVGGAALLRRRDTSAPASEGLASRLPGLGAARRLAWPVVYAGLLAGFVVVAAVGVMHRSNYERWYEAALTYDNTSPQMDAVQWVRDNVPRDDLVMINSYALLELQSHPRTQWYWKVERDPEIQEDILHEDWRGVDYAIVTPNMEEEARSGVIPFVAEIMSHGTEVAYFESDGYWVKVLRVGADSEGLSVAGIGS
ncbi:MAG: phospholipid carrier-dependent glycosyltransferase [Dehalococcoidia bacterium]